MADTPRIDPVTGDKIGVVRDDRKSSGSKSSGSTPQATTAASDAAQEAKAAEIEAGRKVVTADGKERMELAKAQEDAQLKAEQAKTQLDQVRADAPQGVKPTQDALGRPIDSQGRVVDIGAETAERKALREANDERKRKEAEEETRRRDAEIAAAGAPRRMDKQERMALYEKAKADLSRTLVDLEAGTNPSIGARRHLDAFLDELQTLVTQE